MFFFFFTKTHSENPVFPVPFPSRSNIFIDDFFRSNMFGMNDLSERGFGGLQENKGGFGGMEGKLGFGGMQEIKGGFGGMETKLAVSSALGSSNPELGSVTPPHTPPNKLNHLSQQNHVINSLNSAPFQYSNHYGTHSTQVHDSTAVHNQHQQHQQQYEDVHKLNLSHQYDAMNMSEDCFSS